MGLFRPAKYIHLEELPRLPSETGRQDASLTIENYGKDLAANSAAGIEVEFDEQFDAMFSYKQKTTHSSRGRATSSSRRL